jgi:HupE/UreJ protein
MNLKSFFLTRKIDIVPSENSALLPDTEGRMEDFKVRDHDRVGWKLLQSMISHRLVWLRPSGKPSLQVFFLLIAALFFSAPLFAHTINYALEKEQPGLVIGYYLKLGFQHIIPSGLDHILFVSALCLLSTRMKTILWQATAFTIAHSVTLALSMKRIIVVPPAITEPIIALSIVFVAIENILFSQLKPWRVLIVFMFGLIHGMGFASALNEIGLPPNKFYTSILAFNGGVELGQMAIIVLIFSSIVALWGKKDWYRLRIVYPLSTGIAIIATYWAIQRLVFN